MQLWNPSGQDSFNLTQTFLNFFFFYFISSSVIFSGRQEVHTWKILMLLTVYMYVNKKEKRVKHDEMDKPV